MDRKEHTVSGENGTEGQQGDGVEDAGTLRTRFEGQMAEKDTAISTLQVENLVLRAIPGLDTAKPAVQAFIAGYKGEATAEALIEAAKAWDITPPAASTETGTGETPPPAKPTTPVSADESKALGAVSAAAGGAVIIGEGDIDPHAKGLAAFEEEMKAGAERDTASAAYFDAVLGAAVKNPNDDRVIIAGGRVGQDTVGP